MKLSSQHKHVGSGSAKLAAFREAHKNDGNASTNKPTYTEPETTSAEKEKLLKQARFNANVNSLMNAGFSRTEAEDLAAQYFNETNVSIGKILENAPQNATVKLSDGSVTTVSNAAKIISQTTVSTPPSTKKLEASIDKLAKEYSSKGVPKERFFQKVAKDIRTADSPTQKYLMRYSKSLAGMFGESREQSARLADVADTFSMLPAGVKYAVKNPSTIPYSLKQGVTGTTTGIKEDFASNPARAATSLIVSVVLTTKIIKGTSRVASKIPSTKTVINKISTVKVKGKVSPTVAKKITVVERTTNTRLTSLAKDYSKTLKKYDNTYTNVHVIKKGTPRYNKAIKELRSTKTELKTIENKIKNVVDEKIEFQKAVNKLAGKSDSSVTYAGIQKAMGKMSPVEYKTFMGNVKAGKSVAEFNLTDKALTNIASIQKEFKVAPKKVTTYQFERAYKPVEPTVKSYSDPVAKISRLENELSMYCKYEVQPQLETVATKRTVRTKLMERDKYGNAYEEPELAPKYTTSSRLSELRNLQEITRLEKELKVRPTLKLKTVKVVNKKTLKGKLTKTQRKQTKTSRKLTKVEREAVSSKKSTKLNRKLTKSDYKKTISESTRAGVKAKTSLKGVTKTKLRTKTLAKNKMIVLTKLRTEVKTNIQALTKAQIELQAAVRTMTKAQTKTATKVSPATLTATKTQLATVTKTLAAQKTLLKTITSTISKINEMPVPALPKAKIRESKPRGKSRKVSKRYTPKQITNRVATFKQMFG